MKSIFQAGGALPAGHLTYIERQADYEALRAALDDEYLHVIASRQVGKTSLLKRLARDLEERGWRCAYIDLAPLMDLPKTDWYNELGRALAEALTPGDVPKLKNQISLRNYLLNQALTWPDSYPYIALFLDEVEGAGKARDANGNPFSDTFFMTLRNLYQIDNHKGHLVVALAGAVNPDELIKDPDISPFNVGRKINLDDFTLTQAQSLTSHLNDLGIEIGESVHQTIYHWTSGHPYLTQRICSELERNFEDSNTTAITSAHVDGIVEQIINPNNPLQQDKNLRHVAKMLDCLSPLANKLWSRLQAGESVSRREVSEDIFLELYLTGTVKAHNEHLTIRNSIYACLFEQLKKGPPDKPESNKKHKMTQKNDMGSHNRDLYNPNHEAVPSPKSHSQGTTYVTYINRAESLALGNGAQVIRSERRASQAPAPPGINVTLLTKSVPTAFCYQLEAETFPMVTVVLDNTCQDCANAALRISAAIEGYSDTVVASPQMEQGTKAEIALLPLLQPTAIAMLNELRPAILRVFIEQIAPKTRTLHDQTYQIRLHAHDTALLAVKTPSGNFKDLSDYLAAWVTPRHPDIEKLLRKAAEHHYKRQFIGYQGASTLAKGADVVRAQAHAIFEALKQDVNLVYVNSSLNMGEEADQVTQRVRLPTISLAAGGSANCIDGAVLFASLLELASIDPFIVVVPGHAFVGWRIWRGVDQYEFLETTMISDENFAKAHQKGRQQYEDALMKGYFSRGLFDPGGFARLVDVAACRKKDIMPLE